MRSNKMSRASLLENSHIIEVESDSMPILESADKSKESTCKCTHEVYKHPLLYILLIMLLVLVGTGIYACLVDASLPQMLFSFVCVLSLKSERVKVKQAASQVNFPVVATFAEEKGLTAQDLEALEQEFNFRKVISETLDIPECAKGSMYYVKKRCPESEMSLKSSCYMNIDFNADEANTTLIWTDENTQTPEPISAKDAIRFLKTHAEHVRRIIPVDELNEFDSSRFVLTVQGNKQPMCEFEISFCDKWEVFGTGTARHFQNIRESSYHKAMRRVLELVKIHDAGIQLHVETRGVKPSLGKQ